MGWTGIGAGALGGGAAGAGAGAAIGGGPGAAIGAGIGALGGGLLGAFSGGKKAKMSSFEKKQIRKAQKNARRHDKKNMRAIKDYNKLHFGGPMGEKAYNKKLEAFQKKYGEEKFHQIDTLSPEQKSVLNQVLKQGKKGLKNIRTPEDFRKIQKEKLGKRSESTLDRLMRKPGVSDPRTEAIFGQSQGRLENLLNNPSIADLQQYSPFQGAERYTQDLLSETPEAYRNYAAPMIRQFEEEIIPQLRLQHGGKGNQFNRAIGRGLSMLGTNLNSQRETFRQQGANQAINLGQAIQKGQEAQANIFGNSATSGLNFAKAPYESQVANAGIQTEAVKTGIPILDLILKQQGLQNENIQNQNNQAYNFANLGLATPSFQTQYRPPTFHGGIITGGAKPALYGQTQIPQFSQNQPSAASEFGSAFLNPLLQGAGQAGGAALANKGFGGFFSGGTQAPSSTGTNLPFMKNYNPAIPQT